MGRQYLAQKCLKELNDNLYVDNNTRCASTFFKRLFPQKCPLKLFLELITSSQNKHSADSLYWSKKPNVRETFKVVIECREVF